MTRNLEVKDRRMRIYPQSFRQGANYHREVKLLMNGEGGGYLPVRLTSFKMVRYREAVM
jgi:hypothetical protein